MRKLLVVWALCAGCYGSAHVSGNVGFRAPNPLRAVGAVVRTAAVVAAVAYTVATAPPVAIDVEYYSYGSNPGHVWVNGRYNYVGSNWQWQPGYWQVDQPGYYWVQGQWEPRGNQYVWVDGYWAEPRAGYVYTDGYYDYRDNGYVWQTGTWEQSRPGYVYVEGSWTTYGGRRTWQRGGWQVDDGRPEWSGYRARASGGVVIRDHR